MASLAALPLSHPSRVHLPLISLLLIFRSLSPSSSVTFAVTVAAVPCRLPLGARRPCAGCRVRSPSCRPTTHCPVARRSAARGPRPRTKVHENTAARTHLLGGQHAARTRSSATDIFDRVPHVRSQRPRRRRHCMCAFSNLGTTTSGDSNVRARDGKASAR